MAAVARNTNQNPISSIKWNMEKKIPYPSQNTRDCSYSNKSTAFSHFQLCLPPPLVQYYGIN